MLIFAEKYRSLYNKEIDELIDKIKLLNDKKKILNLELKILEDNNKNEERQKEILQKCFELISEIDDIWELIQKKANEIQK
jgi:DNA mismatch repair ATPase MutS